MLSLIPPKAQLDAATDDRGVALGLAVADLFTALSDCRLLARSEKAVVEGVTEVTLLPTQVFEKLTAFVEALGDALKENGGQV